MKNPSEWGRGAVLGCIALAAPYNSCTVPTVRCAPYVNEGIREMSVHFLLVKFLLSPLMKVRIRCSRMSLRACLQRLRCSLLFSFS